MNTINYSNGLMRDLKTNEIVAFLDRDLNILHFGREMIFCVSSFEEAGEIINARLAKAAAREP